MRSSNFFSSASFLFAASSLALSALAAPLSNKRGVSALSATDLGSFAPFTQFARAAYCDSSKITGWTCGEACDANPNFQPTLTGGDGNAVQLFFVGYDPDTNSVVVSHEGTDPVALMSDLTDINFFLTNMNSTLFPNVDDGVKVHNGFAAEHEKTAATILAETQKIIQEKNATQVTLVGHSLGGALAELDSLFMTLNLPDSVHIKAVTYGTPRVGNAAFAALIDSKVPDFVRVNNEKDIVPTVPGRFLGFQHPHGEIHILSAGNAVSCAGDDDDSDGQCTDKTVPNILFGNVLNHLGPYEGIHLGTLFCT